ncbi:MAG TPA: hypothetical protein VHS96_07155, partial [Bacteroidia bacterium]|nr:hypothetical protein [Bacteroidia bacterium]
MKPEFTKEQQQFIDECLSNPEKSAWLSKYQADSVPEFLANYKNHRKHWLDCGKHKANERNYRLTKAMTEADRVIFFIQQKKLFDLQCLWRAEKEEIEGIDCSVDFLKLELNIASLDIIPPIAPEEIELLKEFLLDYHWSRDIFPSDGWQDYRCYIENNCESSMFDLPTYYNYVARKTNTPALWRILPDIRGKKEIHYLVAAMNARMAAAEQNSPRQQPTEPLDTRPRLSNYGDEEAEFAKLFDDYHVNECRAAYHEKTWDEDHELKDALETLKHADEKVKVEEGIYWLDAIKQAAFRHERGKLVAAINGAYENYLFQRKMGIS